MINLVSKGGVSLKQARADCGLPEGGSFANVAEFNERAGVGYTLKSLEGYVIGNSKKITTGTYRYNTNPGTACRRNYAEVNASSPNNSQRGTLAVVSGKADAESSNREDGYQSLCGWSFVGTIPAETANYDFTYIYTVPGTGTEAFLELIGWSSGFHAGTPEYYISYHGTYDQSNTRTFSMNGSAFPYITACLQARGIGLKKGAIRVTTARMRRKL